MKHIITINDSNKRLDKVLSELDNTLSRSMIQKLIQEGKILVNNKCEKQSYKVSVGDVVTIEKIKPQPIDLKPQKIDIDIIYEDKDIIVVNKPKGLIVHPGNGNPDGTLVNAIMEKCKGNLSGVGGKIRPGIIHRLDKDTSGIIVIAKNDMAHIDISNQIKNRKTKKEYIALVRGVVQANEATIDMPIGRSLKDRKKMAVVENGKYAITHFKVLERFKDYTLLDINIETGRTHQIRVHMAEIGYPIVGDNVYSNGKNPFGVTGQMLHAKSIEFTHPSTKKKVKFEAEIPKYFNEVLEKLRRGI